MRFALFFLFVFTVMPLFSEGIFTVHPRNYLLATYFDIDEGQTNNYTVEKLTLRLRSTYTLYGDRGELAVGVARLWSIGSLMNRMKEIDFYDPSGREIGRLVGTIWTLSCAKFSLFNQEKEHVATAYLDTSQSTFSILDPEEEVDLLARFDRTYTPSGPYFWDVEVEEGAQIDERILHILAAFVADAFWPSEFNPDHYFEAGKQVSKN